SQSGENTIEVRVQDETIWLTQGLTAELFQTTKQNISLHLKNIFEDGELDEKSVVKDFLTTAADGKNYKTKFYNLDAIIAVGYRINTKRATAFRQWATVNAYLDLAEDRAKRHIPMTMEDWSKRLDKFLEADDRDILQNSGKITALMAKSFAENEFEKYRIVQDSLFESDFDKEVKRINESKATND
ncbi:virulence RhuM family protein, partial [Bacteroidales bacterium OttesenSCG-928-A14]|nr:virulence RhuM family protein [Bacteroidales bacterium OttesenSCG-928-A14]